MIILTHSLGQQGISFAKSFCTNKSSLASSFPACLLSACFDFVREMRMEIPAEQLAKRKDWLTNLPTCWTSNGFALALSVCVRVCRCGGWGLRICNCNHSRLGTHIIPAHFTRCLLIACGIHPSKQPVSQSARQPRRKHPAMAFPKSINLLRVYSQFPPAALLLLVHSSSPFYSPFAVLYGKNLN